MAFRFGSGSGRDAHRDIDIAFHQLQQPPLLFCADRLGRGACCVLPPFDQSPVLCVRSFFLRHLIVVGHDGAEGEGRERYGRLQAVAVLAMVDSARTRSCTFFGLSTTSNDFLSIDGVLPPARCSSCVGLLFCCEITLPLVLRGASS